MSSYRLTVSEIKVIEGILTKGLRVEVIPLKDRVKIVQVTHKDLSPEYQIVVKERPKN